MKINEVGFDLLFQVFTDRTGFESINRVREFIASKYMFSTRK